MLGVALGVSGGADHEKSISRYIFRCLGVVRGGKYNFRGGSQLQIPGNAWPEFTPFRAELHHTDRNYNKPTGNSAFRPVLESPACLKHDSGRCECVPAGLSSPLTGS